MISLPQPTRIALGTVNSGGSNIELFVSVEWARYFDTLNTQVASNIGTPGPTGPTGLQGPQGPPVYLLQDEPVQTTEIVFQQVSQPEAFIAPTLLNSWVNFDTTFNSAGYYKDSFGIVHLRGLVKSGTVGVAIFTLPTGYRPVKTELFANVSNNAFGRIDIDVSGNVILTTGSNVSASLDGMTFRAV